MYADNLKVNKTQERGPEVWHFVTPIWRLALRKRREAMRHDDVHDEEEVEVSVQQYIRQVGERYGGRCG